MKGRRRERFGRQVVSRDSKRLERDLARLQAAVDDRRAVLNARVYVNRNTDRRAA